MKKFLAVLACSLLLSNALGQEALHFTVALSPTNDESVKFAQGTFTLVGNTMNYELRVPFDRWAGAIHGPARPDMTAPAIFDLAPPVCGVPNPPLNRGGCFFHGTLTLASEQITDLRSDLWYLTVNLQSDSATEYRGQLLVDNDQDGVPDSRDQCLNTSAGAVVNENGCSLEQLCPCDGQWRSHGAHVICVRNAASSFVTEGLITGAEARGIVRRAVRSNCGRH